MAIPVFDENGLLPVGVYDCTPDELEARFGAFKGNEQRPRLMARLTEFLSEARASGIVREVLVDGSFVTATWAPGDIDVVLVLLPAHDRAAELFPSQYNLVSKKRVRTRYGFDMVAVRDGTVELDAAVMFFQQVRGQPDLRKGILENHIMIENTAQLNQAIEQMGRMQTILESYRVEILPKNPRNFAVFAEGPLDEIRKLQIEIDEYLSRLTPASAA